jgi:TolB-like protein
MNSASDDFITPSGLPWPEPYRELLPVIKQDWGISEDLYLTRRLSGKSGALVFAADLATRDFSGQAILKLDRAPHPDWQERSEAERHRLAFEAAPEYAAKHLPSLLHTLHHGSQLAILSSIAGRGLEYALPWHQCPYDRQLESIRRVSGDLLEDWNRDYRLAQGIVEPRALLESWLDYRLDPDEGRLHEFLSVECALSPVEPSISYEGHWYPNPLAFAANVISLPEKVRMRAVRGSQHGDFHGYNLLIESAPSAAPEYFLIDLANYEQDQFLFHDHALFELNYLLFGREHVNDAHWESILDHLSYFRHLQGVEGLRGDDVGLVEMIRSMRRAVLDWVDRHESNRLSYMESQCLMARVAAGLNFANKPISQPSRRKAFLYAASNLKDYLKITDVDWPKHGPPFSIREGTRSGAEPIAGEGRPEATHASHTNPSLPDKPAIAVLAFENLSGDPEQEYFADGISLEILTALSRIDWLMVISRGSTFSYKGQATDPKRVARELGVHYVVEGDVRKSGDRVRVSVRLVSGDNGHTLWVETYERALVDVFALQDDIAQSIVNNIDAELRVSEQESAHRRHGNLSVWDRFQKGLWHVFRFTEADDETAREHMTKLTETAPEFALAHAALAFLDTREILMGYADDPDTVLERALEHATRAVQLDDRSSMTHVVLGRVFNLLGNNDQSLSECEMAIALNPSSSVAYACLAMALFSSDRANEALAPLETSIRLSPRGPGLALKLFAKGWLHYSLGHIADAETIALSIPHREAGPYRWLLLAAVYAHQDRIDDAGKAVDRLLQLRSSMSLDTIKRSWRFVPTHYLDMMVNDLEKAGLPSH